MLNRFIDHCVQFGVASGFALAAAGIQNHVQTEAHYAKDYPSLSQPDLQKLKNADEWKAITVGLSLGLLAANAYFPTRRTKRKENRTRTEVNPPSP